jgi:hypothetical protein
LDTRSIGDLLRHAQPGALIVEGLTSGNVEKVAATCGEVPLVVALPQVFFEDDLPKIRRLV